MSEPPAPPLPASSCLPVDWSCADPDWVAALDEGVRLRAEELAAATLRALTVYQVGGCPVMLRPCATGCGQGTSYLEAPVSSASTGALGARVGPWWAHIQDGQWVNTGCGCTVSPCACTHVPQVVLPAPGYVSEVILDGAVLDPSAWRVDNGVLLVRTDGGSWPRCQDMAAAVGEPDTFGVEYTPGSPADGLAAFAAGQLAVEYAKACLGQACALPDGVRSVSRQGVTWDIPASMFDDGLTGIASVDAVIRIYNPNALRVVPRVWSPGTATARITTQVNT